MELPKAIFVLVMPMNDFDVLIIGAGPAGMAAALGATEIKDTSVLLIERDPKAGGILRQCVHHGFGLSYFGQELTGQEYADRFLSKVKNHSGISLLTDTSAIKLGADRTAVLSGSASGIRRVKAGAVVIATGCRERPIGTQPVTGTRPAGVFTAGMAQRMMNLSGYRITGRTLVLGSGDVGLIVARQIVQSGGRIIAVLEKEPFCGGLERNRLGCLDAYSIPLLTDTTITRLYGNGRITGVDIKNLKTGHERNIACDTLITSIGLIPERELCDELYTTESGLPGWVFICGNACYVHDCVDDVSNEAHRAGYLAGRFAAGHEISVNRQKDTLKDTLISPRDVNGICIGCPKGCHVSESSGVWTGISCGRGEPVLTPPHG